MTRQCWLVILMVSACGRVGFDPLGGVTMGGDGGPGGNSGGNGDAGLNGPGGSDGSVMSAPAGGENCASATVLPLGSFGAVTFTGTTNDYAPLNCPNGVEVVYKVTQATTVNHRLHVKPTFNIILSITNACPPAGGACMTVIANQTFDNSVQFQAGTTYITLDRINQAGTTFEIGLQ